MGDLAEGSKGGMERLVAEKMCKRVSQGKWEKMLKII